MKDQTKYRILEVLNDNPSQTYTMDEALDILCPYEGSVSLKVENGLLHIEGTAFYLQTIKVNV